MAKKTKRPSPSTGYLPYDSDELNKWEDVVDRFGGQNVDMHVNTPRSNQLGTRVFSVVTRTKNFWTGSQGEHAVAHVLGGNLRDPYARMDLSELEQSINKTGPFNKTRNTFIGGTPTEHPIVGESTPMFVRPGIVRINDRSILEPKTEPGIIKLRKEDQPKPGLVVPRNQIRRSGVFAEGATAHRGGFSAINPFDE